MWNRHICKKTFTNAHTHIGIRKTRNWFRYETFYYLFEFKVFRHDERERHNFFLYRHFRLTPPRVAHFVDPTFGFLLLASDLNFQLTQPKRGARSAQSRLDSPRSEYQLTLFFQIPQILSVSEHDVIHVTGLISIWCFFLWHLWLSHPPRACVNTCTQLTRIQLTHALSERFSALLNRKARYIKRKMII